MKGWLIIMFKLILSVYKAVAVAAFSLIFTIFSVMLVASCLSYFLPDIWATVLAVAFLAVVLIGVFLLKSE